MCSIKTTCQVHVKDERHNGLIGLGRTPQTLILHERAVCLAKGTGVRDIDVVLWNRFWGFHGLGEFW